ncbi:hypothetical protein KHQ06_18355 [Nocardia tengchongensis]|uniref:Transcriptional regulator n=1 Tax=Nocardia tengchongensis TaxID=2055889 RepID=A0ABX8CX90_9NOCA|nr:hypothetical protein [Nocardia tengchongensis]QVI24508.1 hypothetical protein KHQ06_18355 [Nocardia tengchongensis]
MTERNSELAELITEAGISWAGLAKRINELGADEGQALRYDYTAIHRWVNKGQKPRGITPTLICRVLSERLSRRVRPADIGMEGFESVASRGLQYPHDPESSVETIRDLGTAYTSGQFSAPFILAALAAPSRDWLLATFEETVSDRGARAIGMNQVAGIRNMFSLFQEMDVMRGGGHARTALISYMNSTVIPLIRREHEPDVQKALYDAAAEQAYLIGWMAYDDGEHGLAQRYLIQALRLSQAAENPVLGAHVLAGMADQANLLGYSHEAVALARAGLHGIGPEASPACYADLGILEARALARLGDATAATKAIGRAERVFDSVDHESEPEWARFIDRAYFFGEAANVFRDLNQPNEIDRFAGMSIEDCLQQRRARRGGLSQAAVAAAHIQRNEIEAAAERGRIVIRLTTTVNSSRCLEAVTDLQRKLKPFATIPQVQEFNQDASNMLGLVA